MINVREVRLAAGAQFVVMTIALLLQTLDLRFNLRVCGYLTSTVDLLRNVIDLVPQGVSLFLDKLHFGRRVAKLHHDLC